jgi:hypothetical protein
LRIRIGDLGRVRRDGLPLPPTASAALPLREQRRVSIPACRGGVSSLYQSRLVIVNMEIPIFVISVGEADEATPGAGPCYPPDSPIRRPSSVEITPCSPVSAGGVQVLDKTGLSRRRGENFSGEAVIHAVLPAFTGVGEIAGAPARVRESALAASGSRRRKTGRPMDGDHPASRSLTKSARPI